MNSADSIIKLNELLEKGAISKSEYEILKAEIINQTIKIEDSKVDFNSNSNNKKKRVLLFGISAIIISILFYFFLLPKEKVVVPFLKLNGKYCVVDTNSMKPIDTCEFEDCRILPNGYILCNSNSKYGLYSKQGKKITELIYSEISNFENGFSVITKEKLQGVIDINGNEIITPKYEGIKILSGDFFAIANNNKWGYCNETGKEIIAPKFDEVGKFSEGLAIVKEDNGFGYINKEGLLVIQTQFKVGFSFINGNAIAQKRNGEICLINKNGETIKTIADADYIEDISEGVFEIKRNSRGTRKSALIDSSGRLLTDFEYYNNQDGAGCTLPFKNGYAAVCKGDFWGVVDKNGKEIIKPKYTNMLFFDEGIASFKRDGIKKLTEGEGVFYYDYFGGKNGIVKLNGEEIQTKDYDGFGFFSEGLVDVSKNNKLGYIDTSGLEVIDLKYDYVSEFSEGLSIVSKNNLSVYIDKRGNEIIDNKYNLDELTYEEEGVKLFKSECSFKNGFARVSIKENNKNLIFYIDRSGKEFREKFEKNNTEIQANSNEDFNKIEFTNLEIDDNLMLSCLEKKMTNKPSELMYENPKIIGRKTYLQNNKTYIFLVLGFKDKNPNACHGCHGFTDLALLEYLNGKYIPIVYFENASYGIYGDYGQLIEFYLFGESNLCVGLASYDEGQGGQYSKVNLLGILENKIKFIAQFYDSERQIDSDGAVSKEINREFKFIKSSKKYYDFELNTFDKVINNKTSKTIQFDFQTKEYKFEE